ncbi:MAG: Trp family transcriptional regulator [Verrucomicrobiota bacterium]
MPKEALNELAAVLADTNDSAAMQDLLEALLTPRERARLALRWHLVCLLTSGMHQRAIARQLGISLCNITRGSRELKRRSVFRQKVGQFVNDQLKFKPGVNPPAISPRWIALPARNATHSVAGGRAGPRKGKKT